MLAPPCVLLVLVLLSCGAKARGGQDQETKGIAPGGKSTAADLAAAPVQLPEKAALPPAPSSPAAPPKPAAQPETGAAPVAGQATAVAMGPAKAPTEGATSAVPPSPSSPQGGALPATVAPQPAPSQPASSQPLAAPGATPPSKPADLVLPPYIVAERSYGILAPPGPILPEDPEIGPLENARSGEGERSAAYAATRDFLEAILKGGIADDAVAKERLSMVRTLAAPLVAEPYAVAYRVGLLSFTGEGDDRSALAPIRLGWAGKQGPSAAVSFRSGEIGLRQRGGAWYVESIRVPGTAGN